MHPIPDNVFAAQQMLTELVRSQAARLGTIFRPYDVKVSVAAAGGLLTVPKLQANTVRLEAICHLIVASAAGKKKPNNQDAARWFKQVGQVFAHMEDAAEDVFVARVHMEGRNYRVLEGLAEANGHHLQHMLTAVENMPDHSVYGALKQSCRAMLALSDLVCVRAGLDAFCLGGEYGSDALPVDDLPTLKTLAARVTFSDSDLAVAGISRRTLGGFCLPPTERDVGFGGYGDRALERQPLIDFGDEIVVALPSAMATAIRRAVIETCQNTGAEFALRTGLLIAQTDELSLNPAISRIDIPPTEMKPDSAVVPSEPVELQPGLWFQLILVTDDFTGFRQTGFSQAGPSDKINAELQQAIDAAASEIKTRPGFKLGFSLIVLCGFGRGQLVEFTRPGHWLAEGISSYDLDVLGWRHDFTIAELLKFLIAEGTAAHMGFPLMAINGLLARIAFAYDNNGHVVPHEAMPDGTDGATLVVPTNAHLRLRAEHHARFDKHAVPDPAGDVLVIRRKDGGKRSPENTQRVYVSHLDARALRYRGAWRSGSRTWWIETIPSEGRSYLYPVFEMQMVWMERLAPILARHMPGLPNVLTWKLVTPAWPTIRSEEIDPRPKEELKAAIRASCDPDGNVVTTEIGLPFFHGLSHPSNVSEVTLIEALLAQVVTLADGAEVDLDELVREIVPSPEARQLHAFAPQDFRDHVRESVPRNIVEISRFDDASQRLGLGWHGLPRPGGTVHGRDECTKVLNAITTAAEEMFCGHLRQFERRALIRRVVENHEASIVNKSRWERTSGAVLDLSANPQETREEVYESVLKANATGQASRVILEAALCECPVGVGFEVADFDLSNLMALAMMIHHLGGYSDAIRYEGMRPEIRISPAGEVQIDVSFFDAIVTPVGESFVSGQIDRSRRDYSELLHDPAPFTEEQATDRTDARFAAAWEAEMGVSLANFRTALEALEDRLVETGQAWEVLPRPALLEYLAKHVDCAEQFVESLELLPRNGWKTIPQPYIDQDRQPWRFRRRLSAARRPVLRLEPPPESDVVIVPGMIRDAFGVLIHNFYYGQYDLSSIATKEMRSWREHIVAKEAEEFEERVVTRLQSFGWQAKRRVTFSQVLGRKLTALASRRDATAAALEAAKTDETFAIDVVEVTQASLSVLTGLRDARITEASARSRKAAADAAVTAAQASVAREAEAVTAFDRRLLMVRRIESEVQRLDERGQLAQGEQRKVLLWLAHDAKVSELRSSIQSLQRRLPTLDADIKEAESASRDAGTVLEEQSALLGELRKTVSAMSSAVASVAANLPHDSCDCPVCATHFELKGELQQRAAGAAARLAPLVLAQEERVQTATQHSQAATTRLDQLNVARQELISFGGELQSEERAKAEVGLGVFGDAAVVRVLAEERQAQLATQAEQIARLRQRKWFWRNRLNGDYFAAGGEQSAAIRRRDQAQLQLNTATQTQANIAAELESAQASVRELVEIGGQFGETELAAAILEIQSDLSAAEGTARQAMQARQSVEQELASIDVALPAAKTRQQQVADQIAAAEKRKADAGDTWRKLAFAQSALPDELSLAVQTSVIGRLREGVGEADDLLRQLRDGRAANVLVDNHVAALERLRSAVSGAPNSERQQLRREAADRVAAKARLAQATREAKDIAQAASSDILDELADFNTSYMQPLDTLMNAINRAIMGDPRVGLESYVKNRRVEQRPTKEGEVLPTEIASIDPRLVHSEGQMAALSVSMLCAASLTYPWSRWRGLVLDDPLQHNDIIHAAAFADFICNLVASRGYQVLLSTHDRAQAEFLRRKMASRNLPCAVLNLLGTGQDGVEWTFRPADNVIPLAASA